VTSRRRMNAWKKLFVMEVPTDFAVLERLYFQIEKMESRL
jgi:hypothetical protein